MVAVILPLLLLCSVLTTYKYAHILWWLSHESSDLASVAVGRIENVQCPDDWQVVRIGSLRLRLPSNLSSHWEARSKPMAGFVFRDPEEDLFVSLPFDAKATLVALHETMHDTIPEDRCNPVNLTIMAYRSGAADFHWSMTREELAMLHSLLAYKRLACSRSVQSLEEVHMQELTGLLSVYKNRASFEWFSHEYAASGTILFGGSGDQINLSWVRPICCSVRLSGQVYPSHLPIDEVRTLLQPAANRPPEGGDSLPKERQGGAEGALGYSSRNR